MRLDYIHENVTEAVKDYFGNAEATLYCAANGPEFDQRRIKFVVDGEEYTLTLNKTGVVGRNGAAIPQPQPDDFRA